MKQRGYTLAGALVMIAVMSILMMLAVELWSWVKRRDNETELIFRGKEYTEAIQRYHAKFNAYPPDLETLLKLKYIRKLYADPMTRSGKWKVLHPDSLVQTGQAGTIVQTGGGKSNPEIKTGGDEDQDILGNSKDKDQDEEPEVESTGPVVGVVSRSKKTSIRLYNNQTTYNKWVFAFALQQQPQQQPNGQPGQPGNPKQGGKPGTGGKPGSQQNPPPQKQPPPPGNNNDQDENDNK